LLESLNGCAVCYYIYVLWNFFRLFVVFFPENFNFNRLDTQNFLIVTRKMVISNKKKTLSNFVFIFPNYYFRMLQNLCHFVIENYRCFFLRKTQKFPFEKPRVYYVGTNIAQSPTELWGNFTQSPRPCFLISIKVHAYTHTLEFIHLK
jgi:hypothetical protein